MLRRPLCRMMTLILVLAGCGSESSTTTTAAGTAPGAAVKPAVNGNPAAGLSAPSKAKSNTPKPE